MIYYGTPSLATPIAARNKFRGYWMIRAYGSGFRKGGHRSPILCGVCSTPGGVAVSRVRHCPGVSTPGYCCSGPSGLGTSCISESNPWKGFLNIPEASITITAGGYPWEIGTGPCPGLIICWPKAPYRTDQCPVGLSVRTLTTAGAALVPSGRLASISPSPMSLRLPVPEGET